MNIIIIGNGISGITAARHIRKLSEHSITVISEESKYFFSRTALMYIYMGHMQKQHTQPYEASFWTKNRIKLKQARVSQIDFETQSLQLDDNTSLSYDKLILAIGSTYNIIPCKGHTLNGVRGLYSLSDLQYIEAHSKGLQKAVIVGGGLIGIELAEMFHSRGIEVTFLVREQSYWNKVLPAEESAMINQHIKAHQIDLRLGTELDEILDDGKGNVSGVRTKDGTIIDCGFVGMTIGVRPNIEFLKNTNLNINRGILVNGELATNIPNVYAIGDCAELQYPQAGRRSIEAIWYTGRMMGETVAQTICGTPTSYNQGIWFNSAKFFDIEYQVYGTVQVPRPAHHADFYWEHESGTKSIRLVYDANTLAIVGFNLMGIRYRHAACEQWIQEKKSIHEVVQNLAKANFDPEFFKSYEHEMVALHNQRFPNQSIPLKRKKWFRF